MAESSLFRGTHFRFKPTEGASAGEIDTRPERVLFAGYYLNHFGHFITETISRLWALPACSKLDKIVFVAGDTQRRKFDSILDALIPEGAPEIEILDRACAFSEVIVPKAGFVIRKSFNTNYWEWIREVSQRLIGVDEHNSIEIPLYLSRSKIATTRRYAYGEKELEDGLRDAGVLIVHPEEHSFADQVIMVAKHKTIIGLEGSQLHSMMFTMGNKKTVQLDYRKVHPNYFLIDRALNNNSTYPSLQIPPLYEGFSFSNTALEPYIFDPQKAARSVGLAIGVDISAPALTYRSRESFALNWFEWWGRKAFFDSASPTTASIPGTKGRPPRVWGITFQQYQENLRCAIRAL